MKKEWIPSATMLFAGAITIFICIYRQYDALFSLERLLAVLIIFLLIGKFAQKALIKIEEATPSPDDADEYKADMDKKDSDEGSSAKSAEDSKTAEKENAGQ